MTTTCCTGSRYPTCNACKNLKKFATKSFNVFMVINKDFKEFIELLNVNNVKYLVIGELRPKINF